MRETHVFLVSDSGEINSIPHETYVALVRREAAETRYANQCVQLADFYVERLDDNRFQLENETYGRLAFDATGMVTRDARSEERSPDRDEYHRAPAKEPGWLPTPREREALLAELTHRLGQVIFGEDVDLETNHASGPRTATERSIDSEEIIENGDRSIG